MFFPFLDYVKVPFSGGGGGGSINIVTLSYKAYVTVEINSFAQISEECFLGASSPLVNIVTAKSLDNGSIFLNTGAGVFDSGQTIRFKQFIAVNGVLHVFRLPENP